MSNLDDKLKEVLRRPEQNSLGATVMVLPTTRMLEAIKQAFADEGEFRISDISFEEANKYTLTFRKPGNVMTGREFYKKFVLESKDIVAEYGDAEDFRKHFTMLQKAAKQAAGLQDE
jgi:hypothetical protein